MAFIFEDLHRGRSVIPPHDVPSRPTLIRWNLTKPLSADNCVVMELADADKHAKLCLPRDGIESARPIDVWGEHVQEVVGRRGEEARRMRDWIM